MTGPAPSTSTASAVIRTGTVAVGERTTFGGRAWRSRGVELNNTALIIHHPSRQMTLPLKTVSALERTDLLPHSLMVRFGTKTYHFSFDSDSELYDWQDDIYSRCPLGATTSNPFDFQHTAHIGSSGATGTFAEPATLPMFEEVMMGRSGAPSKVITPAAAAAAASLSTPAPKSAQTKRRSNPLRGTIILNNNNNINVEGPLFVKPTGVFAGWYWKERWLSLKGNSLTVHTRKTKASPPARSITLSTITSVEPDPKRSNCLVLETAQRDNCMHILFPTDGDMYAWREAIYLRSGLSSGIGSPTDVVHAIHVSYDKESGELKGLPDQWKNDPSLSKPLIAKISMPTGNNSNRSSRRRSQPPAADAQQEAPAPSAKRTSAHSRAGSSAHVKAHSKSGSQSKSQRSSAQSQESQTRSGRSGSPSNSSPLFSNLSRVPAPSIVTSTSSNDSSLGPTVAGGSERGSFGAVGSVSERSSGGAVSLSSQAVATMSSSVDSEGTLAGTPPGVGHGLKAPLSMVHELETANMIVPRP